ncbi:hypothetical protein GCM10011482_06560 [Enterococcus alcedinis]|uniref:Uncharacterized protein n=1 Tax=Enterococcus alcedinis TaxID=1274384 RepID=A0A917N5S3_9ENTE|nr:hypothetical protein [Enterococcus alcedinis]MBP2101603.1 hypothetical protein [Enterococcus alcedinis]GGI65002.1 hypothetical protein GCM10011482_06560 [Enterococcus alcedinis]
MSYEVFIRTIKYISFSLMKKLYYLPFILIGMSIFNINFQYFYLGKMYPDLSTLVIGDEGNMQGAINGYFFILIYLVIFLIILDYVLELLNTPFYYLQITYKRMFLHSEIILTVFVSTLYSFFLCASFLIVYPVIALLVFSDTQVMTVDFFVISKVFLIKIAQLNIIGLVYRSLKQLIKEVYILIILVSSVMVVDLNTALPKMTSFLLLSKNQVVQNYSYLSILLKVLLLNIFCVLLLNVLRIIRGK